jgi:hypothetical protein
MRTSAAISRRAPSNSRFFAMSALARAIQESEFKIVWAKIHVAQVERYVKEVCKPISDLITTEIDPQTGACQVRIGPSEGLPIELFLHMADAVHALNSALDYLWSGLARSIKATDTRTSFPKHETRENLAQSIASSPIKQAFPQAEAFILDKVRPYKEPTETGNFPIWALNRLDNVSKHRFILIAPTVIRFGKFIATGVDGGCVNFSGSTMQTYGPPMKLGLTPPVTLDYEADAPVEIVFVEDQLFSGQPLLETLVNLTEAVEKTRQLFIETFA